MVNRANRSPFLYTSVIVMLQTLPPGPKSLIPGRALLTFRRDPIAFLMSTARDFGDIACFGAGSQQYFLVNHPDHIKDILVTQDNSTTPVTFWVGNNHGASIVKLEPMD